MAQQEVAPASPSKKGGSAKKAAGKKKNQPGRYSQLVVDTVRKLGERSGSSLAKIHGEAKKLPWFDQQNGRTYLKYSVRALVQNGTLLQVKGVGANGSFRLNKAKLEGLAVPKRATPKPAPKKAKPAPKKAKPAPKKAKPAPKKAKPVPKKAKPAAKKSPKKTPKSPKKASKPRPLRAKKA